MSARRAWLVAVLTTSLMLGHAGVVSAQMPPYTAYGMGLHAGDVVTASINGVDCGSARVSVAGNWKISIPAEAPCHPMDGTAVHFAVNGKQHEATVRWSGGGAPVNPRVGIVLGSTPMLAATVPPRPTATPTSTAIPALTSKATVVPTKITAPRRIVTSTPKKRAVFR